MNNRPNILLINVDQQRYDSLGFTGHRLVHTPHLDALAAGGIQFDSAYTPLPVCCPARQSLMSGVMPERHGGLWNYNGSGILPVQALSPDRPLWVKSLRQAGYRTAYLGKWHVNPELDPTHFGFESYDDPARPQDAPSPREKYPLPNNPWPQFPVGAYDPLPLEQCHTHQLAEACIQKMDELGSDAPWHIRLDFPEPHLPCIPAEPFASMYPPETIPPWENFDESFEGKPFIQRQQPCNWGIDQWSWREWSIYLSGYFGMISQVDDAIGRVIAHLESKGLMQDTLIIYTTDHGDAAGSHRMMDKHYVMYEEEVRVPLIMRWDAKIAPGSICHDFLSHFLDIPVTLLDLMNLPVPANYQGQSFLPQLFGEASTAPRDCAFSTYYGQQFGLYCQYMVRDRRYKYVWNATDIDECYDLETDPFEMNNLAASPANDDLCRHYRRKVHEVFTGLDDQFINSLWNGRWLNQ